MLILVTMFFIIFKEPIFPIKHSFYWFSYPRWITKNKSFGFIGIRHNVLENLSKCFNLPVDVHVKVQLFKPGEICHTLFDGSKVCPIEMPNFSIKWWRRNSKIYFTINYLMVPVWIHRNTSSTIKDKVRLISNYKINTRGIFIRLKISQFRNDFR